MTKIFESPDGGNTVYQRNLGEANREIIRRNEELHSQIQEDKIWGEIRRMAKTNPELNKILEQAKVFYHLSKDGNSKT